jgi:HK97 family phage prohead protease
MSDLERRAYVECRIEPTDGGTRIRGYAIVFNSLSVDLGGFREIILPEAIDRTLSEAADVRALVDHDSGKIIGRTRAGTLSLTKRTKGLYVDIQPDPEISYAKDVMRSVARGDVTGMSFGFRVLTDDWRMEDGMPIREVSDMRVSEVSVVGFPAYNATTADVAQRELRSFLQAQRGRSVAMRERQQRQARAR